MTGQSMSAKRVAMFGVVAVLVAGAAVLFSGSFGAASLATLGPVTAGQTLRTSGDPSGIAIDSQRGRAFVSDSKENTLFVFDANTGEPLAYVPTGRQPNQVVVNADRAYVSNFGDASVTVVDTSTNHVVETLAIGGLGIAINPNTGRLYAAGGSHISVLDLTSDKLVASIDAPAGAALWGIAVDPATNRIFATDMAHPRVLVYDGAKSTLLGEVALDAPARFAIGLGPLSRLYVASFTDRNPQLSVIDGVSLKLLARTPTSAFARSIAVDAAGLAYTSGGADGSVTAVDTALRASTKVVVTARAGAVRSSSTSAAAVNPTTGGVVVVTSGGDAPPPRLFPDRAPVVKP
jgi:YVTN family beta-propeller protein